MNSSVLKAFSRRRPPEHMFVPCGSRVVLPSVVAVLEAPDCPMRYIYHEAKVGVECFSANEFP